MPGRVAVCLLVSMARAAEAVRRRGRRSFIE
jgi:hypothetical protein